MEEEKIKPKVMCLFRNGDKLLLQKGYDIKKNQQFYRALGGSIKFKEKAEDAIHREINEELKSEIKNLQFIQICEEIFIFNGVPGHEIIFVFKADLVNKELYQQETIQIIEADGKQMIAEWMNPQELSKQNIPIYPKYDYAGFLT